MFNLFGVRMLEIEEYAKKYNIPIMQKDGIEFLIEFIKKNNIKNILEIGTAIGYSAIKMAKISNDINIISIERDEDRYKEAIKNVSKFDLNDRIKLINDDAFNVELNDKFDLIFIDAAKAQNIKFFLKFEKNLKNNKYIITDNLNFHGLVNSTEIMSRNLRQLVRKIKDYVEFLKSNENYKTIFYDIGDGISVSKKIERENN